MFLLLLMACEGTVNLTDDTAATEEAGWCLSLCERGDFWHYEPGTSQEACEADTLDACGEGYWAARWQETLPEEWCCAVVCDGTDGTANVGTEAECAVAGGGDATCETYWLPYSCDDNGM